MATHKDGIAAAEAIAAQYGITLAELRPVAAQHLNETMPDLEEIGSSDVSIHLASLANHEPQVLRDEALRICERAALLARLSARTGKSEAELLAGFTRLFAPADESDL